MSSDFLYNITPVEKHDNGNKYLIRVEVPLDGWYDDVYVLKKSRKGHLGPYGSIALKK